MQYPKHNFAHNFLNAVETDKEAAWDILINELNEVILDYPKEIEQIIIKSGLRLPAKASAKDKLDVIHDHIYTNEGLRKGLLRTIGKRHQDPHFSADGGEYDKIVFEGTEQTDFNMSGDAMAEDEGTMNFVFSGAKRLVEGAKERVQGAANKIQASQNLANKERQRNLPVSRSKGTMSTGAIIGISLAAAAAIGLVGYLIYKANRASNGN